MITQRRASRDLTKAIKKECDAFSSLVICMISIISTKSQGSGLTSCPYTCMEMGTARNTRAKSGLSLCYFLNVNWALTSSLFSSVFRKEHEVPLEIIQEEGGRGYLKEIKGCRLQDWGLRAGSGKPCWVAISHWKVPGAFLIPAKERKQRRRPCP